MTPGISFATDTIPLGSFAWEMGLPDASWDESDGVRTTTWMADTLLRFGVIDALELQLDADSYGGIRQRGGGGRSSESGGGGGLDDDSADWQDGIAFRIAISPW